MRRIVFVAVLVLLAAAVPLSSAFADTAVGDCADGQWIVRPNQTLGFIAYTCGTTVAELAALNGITNPNVIYTNQVLKLPSGAGGGQQGGTATAPTQAPPPPPATGGNGAVSVTWGTPLYSGDGKVAEIPITVTNHSVTPAIAGGRYLLGWNPGTEGGPRWVTLLGAIHEEIPYPEENADELLWQTTVYTDDGKSFPAFVGCHYVETVYAVGDEPLSRAENIWFHWEVTLPGGWFDCGNSYQVKPENIAPGQSGSSMLTVYLVHPRDPVLSISRKITRVDLELFATDGRSLGIVDSHTFR